MSYLNRVFTLRFMKTLLIVCCIALLIAAIWFLGPFLGFGETRPLQSIEARIILIALAAFCLTAFWLRWPGFVMVVATLCVLVWVPGPFLLLGDSHPLASVSVRLAIIAAILLFTLLYGLWLLLLALKDNPALLDSFTRKRAVTADGELSEVTAAIRDAVAWVNSRYRRFSFFQRVILARSIPDRLPWYVMLGTPDAGKTSAILASGQHFPLPEQLDQMGKKGEATRNCECWFANDAVYVDTAGKYISDPQTHQPEWQALVRALKKYRPVKAINGAIVAFSAADILGRNKAELFALAASLRGRLDDLRQSLGVRFPAYVLVTRVDQLPGFAEYFRVLTEQEREQVWGVTFPWGKMMTSSVSGLHTQILGEFSLLEQRIEREMIVRQQEEYDNRDRKKMYALPQDFHALCAQLADIVQNIFFGSRYDETHSYTSLRGIYFTSSHQSADFSLLNNQAIVRKWSNYVMNKTPHVTASLAARPGERDFLINDVSYGRQYFLKQLFSDVIVKDAGLARHNLANESKYRLQRFLGHTLCIALTCLLLNGIYNSYRNNSRYLETVGISVAGLSNTVNRYVKTANEKLLPQMLSLSRYLPAYRDLDVYSPELPWRYGLYTGTDVVRASESLYQFFLARLLLPQMEQQVTQALQQAVDNGELGQIYHYLKLYLMVFGQGKLDQKYTVDGITQLWEKNDKIQPYEQRQIFVSHLNNLFSLPQWRRFGQTMDDSLVKYARMALEQDDLAGRLYERIKADAIRDAPADLTINGMAKSRGGDIFSPIDNAGTTRISGLFTRAGYHQLFKKKMLPELILLEAEDGWVMGKTATPTVALSGGMLVSPIQEQILIRYLDDYTRQWQDFLSNIGIKTDMLAVEYGNPGMASEIYRLRMIAASDSPLVNLVRRIVEETTLAQKDDPSLLDNISNKGKVLNAADKVTLAWAQREKTLLQEHVDSQFSPLRAFVLGSSPSEGNAPLSTGTSELSTLMNALNEQYMLFVIYDDALKNGQTLALSNTVQQLSVESLTWPDPLRNIISPMLDESWERARYLAISKSDEEIRGSLGQICRSTLQGRYPFADSEREVRLADFEKFFATGGLVDTYFQKHLADKVDTTSHPWRYKGETDDISTGELDIFERGAVIREAFFGDNGRKLSLDFTVSVPYMEPTVSQLHIDFDGTQVSYAHGPVFPQRVSWPGSRQGTRISIYATPRTVMGASATIFTGPWALFRWLDSANRAIVAGTDNTVLVYSLENRRADIEVAGLTFEDTLAADLLKNFRCPGIY